MNNPTLAGGVYGKFITAGRGVYYHYDGSRTRGILFISDGGKYGLDKLDGFEYKGASLTQGTDWIFHRGTYTKQISPFDVTAIDASTNVLTATTSLVNGDLVRVANRAGTLAAGLSEDLTYQVSDKTSTNLKLKDSTGTTYIDITSAGSGAMKIWKADAGFDDPDQGLPTFCPEVATTFNNIAYVEFKLPSDRSSATDPPDWADFRAFGTGRRMMDYNEVGAELGVISGNDDLLANVALEVADNMSTNFKIDVASRIHWPSWKALRDSADVDIWQRARENDDTGGAGGFTGRYYQNTDFTDLRVTRLDPTINMGATGVEPAPGVNPAGFSIRWTATIKPRYTQRYTFSAPSIDDFVNVWIGGTLVVSGSYPASPSGEIDLVADQPYDIIVEFQQAYSLSTNPYHCAIYWQSASQALEVIPATRLVQTDTHVKRYECHMAFPAATEASEVHERLMERVPGWHWTDRDGLVEFLAPDRPIVFTFQIDRMDDDVHANIVKNSFGKKRRPIGDRRNFVLFRYRDKTQVGYPFSFVQAERNELRRFTNGEPTNDPATDLGVMTRSLAERIGEMEMVLKSDPNHTGNLSGGRLAGKIRKNEFVSVSYYDMSDRYVMDAIYMVSFHAWGSKADQNDFTLIPITQPFYTDEPVATSGVGAPTPPTLHDISVSTDDVTFGITNNGGTGDITLYRKIVGGSYSAIATVAAGTTTYTDSDLANGDYVYKGIQLGVSGDTNELSITVSTSPTTSVATISSIANTGLAVTLGIANHGGGNYIHVHRKDGVGGTYAEIGTSVYSGSTYVDSSITADGTYFFKFSQDGESGFSPEQSITITTSSELPPSDLSLTDLPDPDGVGDYNEHQITLDWIDNGATGNRFVDHKVGGGGWTTEFTLASGDPAEYVTFLVRFGSHHTHYFRVGNTSTPGLYTNEQSVFI